MGKTQNLKPIYIVGATASGKTALAIEVVKNFGGELVSADSMQIYKTLDIGTAKVSKEIQKRFPHRMIDIVNKDEEFSVAEYKRLAEIEISNIVARGKRPVIVGGTGLYIDALLYDRTYANSYKNEELRKQLTEEYDKFGAEYLHKKLESLDKDAAEKIHQNNVKRVIRAIEIVLTTGKPLADNSDNDKMFSDNARLKNDVVMIFLNPQRQTLYARINERVDEMFQSGLVDEVYSIGDFTLQSMQAIGYKEFKDVPYKEENGKFVISEDDEEDVKKLIKQHTRNYAKRQITWFKRYPFAKEFDGENMSEILQYINDSIR